MAYQKIQFMSRSLMHALPPQDNSIVISITSPGLEHLNFQEGFKDILLMEFDNTNTLMRGMTRFSLNHAQTVMEFVKKHEQEAQNIYINCLQGESRSAALAHFLADYYQLPLQGDISKEQKWIYEVMARANKWSRTQYAHVYKP